MVLWEWFVVQQVQKFMLLFYYFVVIFRVSIPALPFYVLTFQFDPVIIGSLCFALSVRFLSVLGELLVISPLKHS